MGWFRRKRVTVEPVSQQSDPRDALLATFLELERARLESSVALEQKRSELELERTRLELAELERVGVEKRKNALFQDELKQKRKEQLAAARERKAALKAERSQQHNQQDPGCEECRAIRENRAPHHSSDLIRHKIENHSQRWLLPAVVN